MTPSSALAIVLFSDNFNDGDASGWHVDGVPGWSVQDGRYGISLSGVSNSLPDIWDDSWKNIEYSVTLRGASGVDKNILVKYKSPSEFLEIHHTTGATNQLILDKTGYGELDSATFPLFNGFDYNFRIVVNDDKLINVFINNSSEPVLSATDPLPRFNNWRVGLRAGTGDVGPTQVWFDDVRVTSLRTEPIGPFELPFDYPGRGEDDPETFAQAFFDRYNSLFDHQPAKESFVNFLGDEYLPIDCNTNRAACYDSHTGVDFLPFPDDVVRSVGVGAVVYRSLDIPSVGNDKCKPKGPFGCVVIVDYSTDEYQNLYGLYAHLKEINVGFDSTTDETGQIGSMGSTGNSSGKHLHFASMIKLPDIGLTAFNKMKKSDWDNLASQIAVNESVSFNISKKSVCKYSAPNGSTFVMVDPNGWSGESEDPWAAQTEDGGCGIESSVLWKFNVEI